MSTGSTERLVKYVLTVEVSPDAEQQQKRFKEFMKLTQKEVDQAVKDSADARVEVEKTSTDRITEMQREQLRVLEDINRQSTTLVDMKLAEQTKAEEEAAKAREEREKDSLRRMQDAYKKHVETVSRSAKELTDGYLSAAEGFVTLAQGAASVGILAEEDTEQMLRLVVAIKGVTDTAKGGIELYRGISAAVDGYRASVLAAAAAEQALNAARARGAGTAAANLGLAGNAVTGSAALSSASALPTALAGIGAALTSLPAAIAGALVGVVGAGAMITNVGGSRDRAAAAIDALGRSNSTAQWWIDKGNWALGTSDALISPSSWGTSYATGADMNGATGLAGEQRRAAAAEKTAKEMIRDQQLRMEMRSRHDSAAQMQFELDQQAYQMRRQRELTIEDIHGGPTADSVLERLSRAQARLQDANYQRSVADSMPSDALIKQGQIERTTKLQVQALEEVVALRRQALALQQQEGQQSLAVAKQETQEIERQLEMKKAEQQRIESQLLSARQRFGQMDEATQARAISTFRKAKAGGDLNREESSLLRSVGTPEAIKFAQDADLARADAGGVQELLAESRANVQKMAADKAKLQIELDDKREIVVEMKDDQKAAEDFAKRVGDAIAAQVIEQDELKHWLSVQEAEATLANRQSIHQFGPRTGS
ncbi:hypothetical protein AB1K70_20240 [Bremerella sp. JC770]|uniref:hypothetical protein n=1 Tax=Bremerella sp. JC770 TaxID=3232137 RepID=UPI0034577AA3